MLLVQPGSYATRLIENAVDGGGFTILNFGWAPKGSMGKPPPGVRMRAFHFPHKGIAT